MATANQLRARAREVMKTGAVILTAADWAEGLAVRFQVYFWDEGEAVMDIVSREDLLRNWPDEGVYVLNPAGDGESGAVLPVGTFYDEPADCEYIRVAPEDAAADDLPGLPTVVFMEAVEQICMLKDKK